MDNPPTPVPPAPRGSDKIWSILCHVSALLGTGLVLPLIVYFAMRGESDYVTANAREALNFHLSVLLYGLCCLPLLLIAIGGPLLALLGLASLVLAIIAAIKASEGGAYHYPLTLQFVK